MSHYSSILDTIIIATLAARLDIYDSIIKLTRIINDLGQVDITKVNHLIKAAIWVKKFEFLRILELPINTSSNRKFVC